MLRHTLPHRAILARFLLSAMTVLAVQATSWAQQAPFNQLDVPPIMRKITGANERLEMTVNSSRIFTLEQKIPQAQVNNPDILDLTALSPNQIQIFAKMPGVTQVNLWDENDQVHTVDVIVHGDARELSMFLADEYPHATIRVKTIATGVFISGYIDQPEDEAGIRQIAEQFYPNVVMNMKVGGVHQVLLHVKVMEVSRTKLRSLGFDWASLTGNNMIASSAAGIMGTLTKAEGADIAALSGEGGNFRLDVFDGSNAFFGVLEALRRDDLMKIMAEPTLVTISGRPAYFQSGGEVPVISGGSTLLAPTTTYKPYGTQIDFVPIVLGNGMIRLEVRPRVSEVDASRSIEDAPAFRVRQVDTAVEMRAGQTLAIAGLVQDRVESSRRGLPWLSEAPYIGALFRRVVEQTNEIELIILVTPQLVEPMEPHEVPLYGPGQGTRSPSDWELYMKGHLEVPNCGPPETSGGFSGMGQPAGDASQTFFNQQSRPEAQVPLQPVGGGIEISNPRHPEYPPIPGNRSSVQETPARTELPGFMGPIGYDGGN